MKNRGITLVALVVTIIILLILAGITINALSGENGLIAKVNQAKKAQIKAEMKEILILAINELQLEKQGNATLDDITQDWANGTLDGYNPQITTDASINGKKVTMKKDNVTGKYIIDENLNITELEEDSSIEFSYEVKSRTGGKVQILIHVQDEENGLSKIEFPDREAMTIEENKKEEKRIEYEVELKKEYKIKITSENGQTKEETILITNYWYEIKKNLGEGIGINNTAIKAAYNEPYQATITTGNEYILETLTVTMGGQAVTTSGNNVIDKTTGTINIEKVTGDIEITATAKKLEIQYTAIAIGTSNSKSNTSSVADNSQTKGTTLYINIIANIEGTACTTTLKSDSTKTVPYAITKNGKYVFTVSGIYNEKIISEEKEIIVNKYQSAQGLVQYDAGDWTETEIQSLQTSGLYNLNASKTASATSGLNFTFGGFTYKGDTENSSYINSGTIVTSRNQSVSTFVVGKEYKPKYDGWQILESHNENNKTYVTKLVHAGCPENFVHHYGTYSHAGEKAEYLLSSGLRQTGYSTFDDGKSISPRSWQMYVDQAQKNLIADTLDKDGNTVKDIHVMTYDEGLAITGDSYATAGIRNTGSYYWLASAVEKNEGILRYVLNDGKLYMDSRYCFGVRPVVSLKSGVYIESGDGTDESPYVLGIDQ